MPIAVLNLNCLRYSECFLCGSCVPFPLLVSFVVRSYACYIIVFMFGLLDNLGIFQSRAPCIAVSCDLEVIGCMLFVMRGCVYAPLFIEN